MFFEANWPLSAMVALNRFIAHYTNHVDALVTRARTLVKLGRRIEAAQDTVRPSPTPRNRSRKCSWNGPRP